MGGILKPKSPSPPDPNKTAAAQTATNIGTAVANTYLNNPKQVSSRGTLETMQTGSQQWRDPATGKTYTIPTFTQRETLSAPLAQADLRNQHTQNELAKIGLDQSKRVGTLLGDNMSLAGAPASSRVGTLQGGAAGLPSIQSTYGDAGGYEGQVARVEDALMQRMNPQLDRERAALEQRLADSGITVGSEGYTAAMDNYGRMANDARFGAILNAGQEQNRLAGLDRDRASFSNMARQQGWGENQAMADAAAADRADYINEVQLERNQPLNEISALLSGSQVQSPRFTPANTASMPTVDYAGLVNNEYNQRVAQSQAKADANMQLLLGGMRLGGAAMTGGFI